MKNNFIINVLSSLPVILIFLYFMPFLGIFLILLRCFIKGVKKNYIFFYIVIIGLVILIPKGLQIINMDISKIIYLEDIVNSDLYNIKFVNYSKNLVTIGIIFLILSYVLEIVFNKLTNKINRGIKNYINDTQIRTQEIDKQNNMEIKIKQEKAKNTSYVKCPNCGSDNLLGEKFGICKYCRSKLENKSYKA